MSEEQPKIFNNTPPIIPKRNEYGLLENVNYIFDEKGKVNWRKMVPPEFLVPNSQKTDETDITKLQDSELLILLAGLRNLGELRGFTDISYRPITATDSYCCMVCRVTWIPNYETEGKEVSFEAVADASPATTEGFGKNYLAAIAENRALARCIRGFLIISICSREEIADSKPKRPYNKSSNQQVKILQQLMDEKGVTFAHIKEKLVAENYPDVENINSLEDVSKDKLFDLISRLKAFKGKQS